MISSHNTHNTIVTSSGENTSRLETQPLERHFRASNRRENNLSKTFILLKKTNLENGKCVFLRRRKEFTSKFKAIK